MAPPGRKALAQGRSSPLVTTSTLSLASAVCTSHGPSPSGWLWNGLGACCRAAGVAGAGAFCAATGTLEKASTAHTADQASLFIENPFPSRNLFARILGR